jgi:cobalt/nickel transport system permease protein
MSNIMNSILEIATLEELTQKDTPIHRLQPSIKLLTTVIYLVTIISFNPKQVSGLIPYIFYPIILMALGEIPFMPLFRRLLIALPFTLFTGISNIFFSREIALYFWNIGITDGMVSFCSIFIKTILTVMAVLILISTTSINDLVCVMINFKIPSILVIQIMMTYRYITVLLEEISVMYHAYILRAPKEKGIKLKDTGPFVGQLIIRSFDRADRIYNAMKCRGFDGDISFSRREKISRTGWVYLVSVGGLFILMRFVNISEVIGNLLM